MPILTIRFTPSEVCAMIDLAKHELRRVPRDEETERYKDMLIDIIVALQDHREPPKTAQEAF